MDATRLDQVLRRAVEAGDVPGVVALAADREGVLYEGAFGRCRLPDGPAMTPDSVFWIASMTKAVTSVAAMQLVERGGLRLDEPVAGVLPELAAPQVLEGFDASGSPRLRPARRPITLRHLLTHTAGLGHELWSADLARYMRQAGLPSILSCREDALRVPLVADPGERWEYGTSTDWLGKAVERVSGLSLEAYFRERVLGPLGMDDTGFTLGPDQRRRLAAVHARQPDGSLRPVEFGLPQEPEFFMGGGGLHGTGPDYVRLLRMFLNRGRLDGAEVLRPETVDLMASNQIGGLEVGALRTVAPELSNDAEAFPGMVKRFGLGFLINTEAAPTGRSPGSLAWAGLANTYFWIDPAKDLAGVILTQIIPSSDPKALSLLGRFEAAVHAAAGPLTASPAA